MVRFPPRSALPEVEIAARNQLTLKWKTVDPTLYTNYKSHLLVICATVAQTECYKQVILHRKGFTDRFIGIQVLLRSCDWSLSVIVTDVSITAAEIITRVNWTIVVHPSIRTDSPTPQLMSTTMGIGELPHNLDIISIYSNRRASKSKFKAQLWALRFVYYETFWTLDVYSGRYSRGEFQLICYSRN